MILYKTKPGEPARFKKKKKVKKTIRWSLIFTDYSKAPILVPWDDRETTDRRLGGGLRRWRLSAAPFILRRSWSPWRRGSGSPIDSDRKVRGFDRSRPKTRLILAAGAGGDGGEEPTEASAWRGLAAAAGDGLEPASEEVGECGAFDRCEVFGWSGGVVVKLIERFFFVSFVELWENYVCGSWSG